MSLADRILAVNRVLQEYMRTHGLTMLTADQAAKLVYDAVIIVPSGPPGAPAFAFRDFLRDIRKEYGYDALYALLGVTQSGNRPQGRYAVHKVDSPSKEKVEEILKAKSAVSPDRLPSSSLDALPDYLQDGLDVVFVGTSAGEESAKQEHYYADLHNRFWDLVNQSDLVSDMIGAENDHLVLDEKCGLTDLVKKRVSSSDSNLEAADFDIDGFIQKIEMYKPKVVAFNGKRAYKEVFKKDPNDYGLADDIIGDSYVFVLPSSSGTDTSMTFEKKLHWYKKLKATLRTL